MAVPVATSDNYPAAVAWAGGVLFALGTGCAAALLQRWFAPVGVFPLAIGVITGLAVGGLWAGRGGGSRRAIVAGAALAGLTCITAWHVATYAVARRDAEAEQRKVHEAMVQLMPDPSFVPAPEKPTGIHAYFGALWHAGRPLGEKRVTRWWLAAWWTADAALVLAGAVLTAAAIGKPFPSRGAGFAAGEPDEAATLDEPSRRSGASS